MRKILMALALIGACGTTGNAHAEQPQWFVAHIGDEACVPLDDVGPGFKRLHYHSGALHRPGDLVTVFRLLRGVRKVTMAEPMEGAVIIAVKTDVSEDDIEFPLFKDRDLCQRFMAKVDE